ncbi:MAG: hypothetical protein O7F16_07760 [Acidobacteria bacterium]|nr:hypothetical protein [Acidobacteriota bacterium]
MQGPARFLRDLKISLSCAVIPGTLARLDADHREFVNYETYYFSSLDAKTSFLAQAHRYTGPLTDPVTLERFRPGEDSPRRRHAGRLFYFTSESTVLEFDDAPALYSTPRLAMRELKSLESRFELP